MNKLTIKQGVDYVLNGNLKLDFNYDNLNKIERFLSNFPHRDKFGYSYPYRHKTDLTIYEPLSATFEILDYTQETVYEFYLNNKNGKILIELTKYEFNELFSNNEYKDKVKTNKEYYQVKKDLENLDYGYEHLDYIDDYKDWKKQRDKRSKAIFNSQLLKQKIY